MDEFYKALMTDVGESGDMIIDDADLSKTEELFEADMVAVENSINEPRNSTLLATEPEQPVVELDNSDIDNSILELSALEEQLSDLRNWFRSF